MTTKENVEPLIWYNFIGSTSHGDGFFLLSINIMVRTMIYLRGMDSYLDRDLPFLSETFLSALPFMPYPYL